MYVDALGLVSDAQAFAGTAVSTNSIDLGNVTPRRAIGTGEPVGFGVAVDVAADFTTGDETYELQVVDDEDPALGSPRILASYPKIAAAGGGELAAGSLHFLPIPQTFVPQRYIGIRLLGGGTTPTVTLTAWLTAHSIFSVLARSYAKGYTIS